jgi:hypothetical protein
MVLSALAVKSGLLFCWMHIQRQARGSVKEDGDLSAVQQTMFSLLGDLALSSKCLMLDALAIKN